MNKQDLTKLLANKFELPQTKASDIISHILEAMTKALAKNDTIQFIGFGSFSISKRKARTGRNPKTGEAIKIPACKTVRFSAGQTLKASINKK
jgi:DNA-binding protein HU-beta